MDNVDEKFASVVDYSKISLRVKESDIESVRHRLFSTLDSVDI